MRKATLKNTGLPHGDHTTFYSNPVNIHLIELYNFIK